MTASWTAGLSDAEEAPLKYVADIRLGKMLQREPSAPEDREVRYIKAAHVTWSMVKTNDLPTMYASPGDLVHYQVRGGDLLVCEGGEVGRSAILATVEEPTIIQNAVHRVRSGIIDTRYLHYCVQAIASSGWFDIVTSKATIAHLTVEKLGRIRIPFRLDNQQRLIADFLDRETHRIDALVNAKRRMIERLLEKRDSLITRQTWSDGRPITKLAFHVDLVPGYAFPSEGFSSSPGDIALLRGTNVGVGRTRWDDAVYWPQELLDGLQRYQLQVGDIVLGLDRPWITGGVRVAAIEASDLPALVLQRVLRIRARQTVAQSFIFYLLQSRRFLAHFEPDMTGISVPHISPDQVAAFAFPLPPGREQEEVVAELNRLTSGISSAIDTLTRQLDLLAEYRQALITQAVTGRLDEATLKGDKPVDEAVGVIPE